jgi:lipoprotein-anchoring transpeptidase ErfK/SrfK
MPDGFELTDSLSRREFLKLSSSSLLGLALPIQWTRPAVEADRGSFGRVLDPTVEIYSRPSFASEKLKTLWRDDVFEVVAAWIGDAAPEHNRVWYEVQGLGFTHSSAVQPVRDEPNEPLERVPDSGILTELTVPYIDAHWKPREDSEKAYRFYYGSTFWVTGVSQDVSLRKWYRVLDDKYAYTYYAPAEAFRPIPNSQLIPLASDVPARDKRIEVDLANQWVRCFEGSHLVFTTKVSTGRKFGEDFYWTPEGSFETFRKRPSRHMSNGNLASGYDIPGVPWVSYIDENGISFHGTYWHNDFGNPRSHGCINMTMDASKWLFRWTHPIVPMNEIEVWRSHGTTVRVRY